MIHRESFTPDQIYGIEHPPRVFVQAECETSCPYLSTNALKAVEFAEKDPSGQYDVTCPETWLKWCAAMVTKTADYRFEGDKVDGFIEVSYPTAAATSITAAQENRANDL